MRPEVGAGEQGMKPKRPGLGSTAPQPCSCRRCSAEIEETRRLTLNQYRGSARHGDCTLSSETAQGVSVPVAVRRKLGEAAKASSMGALPLIPGRGGVGKDRWAH